MEKQVIRVAVIGGGAIAQRRHLPEYETNPHAEIAGIYERNPERSAALCSRYHCKAYDSLEALLTDDSVDAVSVCSPNVTHAETSIKLLQSGKHVLCEKPMALTLEQARAMLDAEKASGRILMPGHNQRLIRAHIKARELLESGAIGKLLFFQCNFKHAGPENWSIENNRSTWFFQKNQTSFGVMGDLGAHKIDLIRYLTGGEIKSVFATMTTLDKRGADGDLIELEDNAICEFKMEDGMPGIMHFSWTNYGKEDNSTVVYGTKGVMKIFGDYADDIVLEMRDGSTVKYTVGAISTNANQLKSGVIDEFVDSILKKRPPAVTGVDGYNTLAVIVKAMESAREGRWLDIVY